MGKKVKKLSHGKRAHSKGIFEDGTRRGKREEKGHGKLLCKTGKVSEKNKGDKKKHLKFAPIPEKKKSKSRKYKVRKLK